MAAPLRAFTSKLIPLVVDNVDTDQIIPARFLKGTSKDGLGEGLFADWRYDGDGNPREGFVLNRPELAGRAVLLAGANFGSGSSREHAAWALQAFGVKAVLAPLFADIFRNNALKNGLLPVELPAEVHAELAAAVEADPEAEVTVDLEAETVDLPGGRVVGFRVDPFARQMLLDGTDELGYLLSRGAAVAAYEDAHPSRVDTTAPAWGG
ncbi:MAG TPA: 3-isopropylmalate dehydratase small subunit [Actinomycetota bacterium]|nr:3-isopropylmalate dehydratase small subunit [Actinomycetota bacterium]